MSESYAKPWTSATIHVNLDTGEMHSDGDHLVRQWIQETIAMYKMENAELLAACKEACKTLDEERHGGSYDRQVAEDILLAAITKAEEE